MRAPRVAAAVAFHQQDSAARLQKIAHWVSLTGRPICDEIAYERNMRELMRQLGEPTESMLLLVW